MAWRFALDEAFSATRSRQHTLERPGRKSGAEPVGPRLLAQARGRGTGHGRVHGGPRRQADPSRRGERRLDFEEQLRGEPGDAHAAYRRGCGWPSYHRSRHQIQSRRRHPHGDGYRGRPVRYVPRRARRPASEDTPLGHLGPELRDRGQRELRTLPRRGRGLPLRHHGVYGQPRSPKRRSRGSR